MLPGSKSSQKENNYLEKIQWGGVLLVGYCGDMVGLKITYYISAAMGMAGIPFIFMLPERNKRTN